MSNRLGHKNWTPEEDQMLREMWGNSPVSTICAKLGRSRIAIANRKTRLGLGRFYENGDYVTLNQLYNAIYGRNVNSYQVKSWIQDRGLPVMRKTRGSKYAARCIHIEQFWKWAEKNRDIIDFAKFPKGALGAEPEWVEQQRKFSQKKACTVTLEPWSSADDEKLKFLLSQYRYTTTEIAARLCRTEGAVIRRISTLKLKARPIRNDPHTPWTDEELGQLVDLIRSGANYVNIAEKIPRHSEKAIRGIVWQNYHTEKLDKVRELLKSS